MADEKIERKLAVIFATDVVGFSTAMETNETETLKSLRACKEILNKLFEEHSGRIFNTAGDSVLAEFQSAVSAVVCASEFQKFIKNRNVSITNEQRMDFRIGVNMGDVIVEGTNLYGEGVNIAARLESYCPTGGIAISKNIYELINQKVDFKFDDKGHQNIKNTSVHTFVLGSSDQKESADFSEVQGSPKRSSSLPTIAILPLKNLSSDEEQEYFADGVSEDLIAAVSKYKWLRVIARNSSFSFKNNEESADVIGQKLGANYILTGTIRKAGQRVRISVELIELPAANQIWTERFDRTLDDIFDLQDEITYLVAAELEPQLSKQERKKAKKLTGDQLGAWDYFQKAQWHIYQFTPDNIEAASTLYSSAIDLDPQSSSAYAGSAIASILKIIGGVSSDTEKLLLEASEHAEIANKLDDENPFAFYALGRVRAFQKKHEEADFALNKAIEINPSYALAYHGLAQAYMMDIKSDKEKALGFVKTAIKLSPRDPLIWAFYNIYSGCCVMLERDKEALEAAQKAASYPNAGVWAYLGLSATLVLNNEVAEAREVLATSRKMMPNLSQESLRNVYGPALTRLQSALEVAGLD